MHPRILVMLTLTFSTPCLSGCAELSDLPVVGPAVQSMSGVLDPLLGPLGDLPIIGTYIKQLLPKQPDNPANQASPQSGRIARTQRAAGGPVGAATTTLASASTTTTGAVNPDAAYLALTQKNKQFDRLRTWGLMQLYSGQTAGAIAAFKQAQALRPTDAHISQLLNLSEHPQTFKNKDGGGMSGSPTTIPQPQLPDGMALPSNLPPSLPNGNAAPTGDKPGGLF